MERHERCTNAEPGTFNHECGKRARWIGTHASGHRQAFRDLHKAEGYEARTVQTWEPKAPTRPADRPIGARVIVSNFGRMAGTVIEHDPRVTIQERERVAEGWIRVKLDGDRPAPWDHWAGDPALTDLAG